MFTADQAEVYQATTTNQMTFTKAEKAKNRETRPKSWKSKKTHCPLLHLDIATPHPPRADRGHTPAHPNSTNPNNDRLNQQTHPFPPPPSNHQQRCHGHPLVRRQFGQGADRMEQSHDFHLRGETERYQSFQKKNKNKDQQKGGPSKEIWCTRQWRERHQINARQQTRFIGHEQPQRRSPQR